MCWSAFRWTLSAYPSLSSGKTFLSARISLGRAGWCSWWSLEHDSSHAKEDAFIQPDGSLHYLHWLHWKCFHQEFAHLEHTETPTPFAVLFCHVLPCKLGWVLQVMPSGHQKGLGFPWVLCPVNQNCTSVSDTPGLLKQHQTLHGQLKPKSANFSLDAKVSSKGPGHLIWRNLNFSVTTHRVNPTAKTIQIGPPLRGFFFWTYQAIFRCHDLPDVSISFSGSSLEQLTRSSTACGPWLLSLPQASVGFL